MHRLALLILAAVLAGCPSARAGEGVPSFTHIVVIVFENKEERQIVGSADAPTFATMAQRYARLTQYEAVTHPSLPNYLALVSGTTQGIRSDCTSCIVDARNLADSLGQAGRSWKTYAEGLPRAGYTGARSGSYDKKLKHWDSAHPHDVRGTYGYRASEHDNVRESVEHRILRRVRDEFAATGLRMNLPDE